MAIRHNTHGLVAVTDEDDGATSHHYGGDVDDNDDNGEVADIDGLHCSEGQL